MNGIASRFARIFLRPGAFLPIFWLAVGLMALFVLATIMDRPLSMSIAASIVIGTALLPIYFWCAGTTPGLPIFALHSLAIVWVYGFQFLKARDIMSVYSDAAYLDAAITIALYLVIGTAAYVLTSRIRWRRVAYVRVFATGRGEPVLFAIIGISVLFTVAAYGDWLSLSGGLFAILRGIILGLNVLAIFVLSHRAGSGELSPPRRFLFGFMFVCYCLTNAASLFLIGAIIAGVVFLVGYTLGGNKVPITFVIGFALAVSILHVGKGELRARYWTEGQGFTIQPWQYPSLYMDWAASSSTAIFESQSDFADSASIFERSSTLALLLFVQHTIGSGIPPLEGATYRPIPEVLIPRIFNEEKISAQEGNTILNVYFGLQTREATETTTIGWGLLNEAYANFGNWGCTVLAVIMGGFYGGIAGWASKVPMVSLRNLIAVLCLAFTLQTEFCATVFVSAFFQSVVAVWLLAFLFMLTENVVLVDSKTLGDARQRSEPILTGMSK